ncbi:MAG TPA: lysophospholipid acyltransferase family protein [Terriglobales bacterium]|nr:lysophospholipid acyltransferase family protein [Terriglobales bacterium]
MKLAYFVKHAFNLAVATLGAFAHFVWRYVTTGGKLSLQERALWLHRWCAYVLPTLSVRIQVEGSPPTSGMIVSNHLSYLDILVFSAVVPTLFVAKREVRSWLVFGLLAHLAGTRFLDRARSADAHRVQNEVQEALEKGSIVVVFPEGTSTDGNTVLPFKPALFEAVVGKHTVTPARLTYSVTQGSVSNDVCYWGDMTFFPHLLRLLSKPSILARVDFAPATHFDDRKLAAIETREQVLALG